MKYILLMLIAILSFGCAEPTCEKPVNGKAVIVAFKVAKHSRVWLKNPQTNLIDRVSLGKRKQVIYNMGDTIDVLYCGDRTLIDRDRLVRRADNTTTRFESLQGYENLK